jgi:sigma-B regulation protein RsbU (phosphoserine phosphatase)
MSVPASHAVVRLFRRLSRLERVTLLVGAVYLLVWAFAPAGSDARLEAGLWFVLVGFLLLAFILRLQQHKDRLLWSLRNRLLVAYVFSAIVPVVLLLLMGYLSLILIHHQLGAYLFKADLERKLERMEAMAEGLVLNEAPSREVERWAGRGLPGLRVRFGEGGDLLEKDGGGVAKFLGLVQVGSELELTVVVPPARSARPILVAVPMTAEFLSTLAEELGPIQMTVNRPMEGRASEDAQGTGADQLEVRPLRTIMTEGRRVPPPVSWWDQERRVILSLDARVRTNEGLRRDANPVYVALSTRTSVLNAKLFASLGRLTFVFSAGLVVVGVLFLIIQVAAFATGFNMTRTITRAVNDLYQATLHVQAGDFSHRVRTLQRDQLGSLGESFNTMTSSVATLIEEQKRRQRLENELAIAQQVQSQLFPQVLPAVPGISLAAVCRAARVVSGDYYDFISLGPKRLGVAIADISGKGISAALLMASLQAALRSQLVLDGDVSEQTRELVTRLNLHLYLNTSSERYATLFYASYDADSRLLHYTNAGHLPPLLLVSDHLRKLEEGGMVVGLFQDASYEQGSIKLEPGSLLVAYSDGLVEPENVYGEQFGVDRLAEEILRRRDERPEVLAESLIRAAEEWGGSAEQADDITVIVMQVE